MLQTQKTHRECTLGHVIARDKPRSQSTLHFQSRENNDMSKDIKLGLSPSESSSKIAVSWCGSENWMGKCNTLRIIQYDYEYVNCILYNAVPMNAMDVPSSGRLVLDCHDRACPLR